MEEGLASFHHRNHFIRDDTLQPLRLFLYLLGCCHWLQASRNDEPLTSSLWLFLSHTQNCLPRVLESNHQGKDKSLFLLYQHLSFCLLAPEVLFLKYFPQVHSPQGLRTQLLFWKKSLERGEQLTLLCLMSSSSSPRWKACYQFHFLNNSLYCSVLK